LSAAVRPESGQSEPVIPCAQGQDVQHCCWRGTMRPSVSIRLTVSKRVGVGCGVSYRVRCTRRAKARTRPIRRSRSGVVNSPSQPRSTRCPGSCPYAWRGDRIAPGAAGPLPASCQARAGRRPGGVSHSHRRTQQQHPGPGHHRRPAQQATHRCPPTLSRHQLPAGTGHRNKPGSHRPATQPGTLPRNQESPAPLRGWHGCQASATSAPARSHSPWGYRGRAWGTGADAGPAAPQVPP
jgi:hypothetical protein